MQIYRVGGSVRDELLGRLIQDRDYVVVGATPEKMIELGFKPVGKDFPVFLHPQTKEEYALARTERKSGRGHQGFQFYAAPEVTLEDDLKRRDLTINAMARDANGRLIDPYGGERDLRAGILRHVSSAFVEDPLRVLRVARFVARYGFTIAAETMALMRKIAASGELHALSAERVWQELALGLQEDKPSLTLLVLHRCGALKQFLPEVSDLSSSRRKKLLQALDCSAARNFSLGVRYAVLAAGSSENGKVNTQLNNATNLAQRLKVPTICAELSQAVIRYRGKSNLRSSARDRHEQKTKLSPALLLDLLQAIDALRRPERLVEILQVCECLDPGQSDLSETYLLAARKAILSVRAQPLLHKASGIEAKKIIRKARLQVLRRWLYDNDYSKLHNALPLARR